MQKWQLQEAKAKLSKLVKPKKSLFDMFRSAPKSLADFDLSPRKDIRFRNIKL